MFSDMFNTQQPINLFNAANAPAGTVMPSVTQLGMDAVAGNPTPSLTQLGTQAINNTPVYTDSSQTIAAAPVAEEPSFFERYGKVGLASVMDTVGGVLKEAGKEKPPMASARLISGTPTSGGRFDNSRYAHATAILPPQLQDYTKQFK